MNEPTTRLRITLDDVSPKVWRRVEVPIRMTLYELHRVIQAVMGWGGYHLYEFRVRNVEIGRPMEDGYHRTDDRKVTLEALIDQNISRFKYVYDFGDDWRHEISIGTKRTGADDIDYPVFLGGENNCPPEDVGGPWGYEQYLSIIADPSHEDHELTIKWNGVGFDPSFLDERLIIQKLKQISRRRRKTAQRARMRLSKQGR